jgi:hypothetical protein
MFDRSIPNPITPQVEFNKATIPIPVEPIKPLLI